MRIVIAPDSFKECLTASDVASAIARGWHRAAPDDELVQTPLADGGEGTTTALTEAGQGQLHNVQTSGPDGRRVSARFGLLADKRTAIVEVAEASGLHRVSADHRNALSASSAGTGELILAALEHRPDTLVIGLGGSATTDGGAGILQALGARLLDDQGRDIPPGGAGLAELASLDVAPAIERVAGVRIVVACDVTNPLTGPEGAAAVFGPQKGASARDVEQLDANLRHLATLAQRQGMDIDSFPGSGAAGGIGGMIAGILGGELRPGIELVMETVGLEQQLRGADLVITAEGSIDAQSAGGKTPAGVAALANRHGIPVLALAGRVGSGLEALHRLGITAVFPIAPGPVSLDQAYSEAGANLERTAEQLARLTHGLRGH